MALSNIFKEPKREITESVVGILALGIGGYLVYSLSSYVGHLMATSDKKSYDGDYLLIGFILTLFGTVLVPMVTALILMAAHALGEGVCNWLAKHDVELRPKVRRI